MTERYFQCRLRQYTPQGHREQVAWIAERGAKAGAVVEILDDDDGENGHWSVWTVGDVALSKDELREKQKNDRNSLPSIT